MRGEGARPTHIFAVAGVLRRSLTEQQVFQCFNEVVR